MSQTILIVEDEFLIARDIRNILHEEGYNVIIDIESVEDALEAIELHKPNLVILDINLKKDKDGIDVAKYLLMKDRIPYIFITSSADKTTLERVSETRPYGYIVKPFKKADIKASVEIALNNFIHRKIDVVRREDILEDKVPFIMKQVINYINENINEKIESADLMKITRWDSQHFSRLFAQYVGVTPFKYITNRKIEKAKVLLTESSIPITQISFELAFKSHSNFCSIFKKHTGKTPENFRKHFEVNNKYMS